jgi:hypothetical protein
VTQKLQMATRLMRPAGGAATARPVPRTPALLPLPAARPAASAAAAAASCSLLRSRMLARRLQRGLSVSAGAQAGEPPAAAAGADTAAAQEQQVRGPRPGVVQPCMLQHLHEHLALLLCTLDAAINRSSVSNTLP